MAQQGLARNGKAWQSAQGLAWRKKARYDAASLGNVRQGLTCRYSLVQHSKAWYCAERLRNVRQGLEWRCKAWKVTTRLIKSDKAWLGSKRLGRAWQGLARCGMGGQDRARLVFFLTLDEMSRAENKLSRARPDILSLLPGPMQREAKG
jgi:hypothetical protein